MLFLKLALLSDGNSKIECFSSGTISKDSILLIRSFHPKSSSSIRFSFCQSTIIRLFLCQLVKKVVLPLVGRKNFHCLFNVYPYIPNEAIFHLIYFQSSSKISKIETFFELSYPPCCDALKYFFLHFKIKQIMHHFLLGFPISP